MNLELSDEQTAALESELDAIIENDRYPLSPRIRTLRESRRACKPEVEPGESRAMSPLREHLCSKERDGLLLDVKCVGNS
jgi:hypothetical protein